MHQAKEALKLTPRDAKAYSFAGLMHDRFGQPREAIDYLRPDRHAAPLALAHYDELKAGIYAHAERSPSPRTSAIPTLSQKGCHWSDGRARSTCWLLEKPNCFRSNITRIRSFTLLRRTFSADKRRRPRLARFWPSRPALRQLFSDGVRALKIQPDRPGPFLTLARTLHRGGAIGLYKRALELQPSKPALYREYGELLADLRYYQQANNAYRSSIELEPREPAGYEALAELRLRRNRPDEAFEFANQSLSLLDEAPSCTNADPGTDKDAYKEAAAAAVLKARLLPAWRLGF